MLRKKIASSIVLMMILCLATSYVHGILSFKTIQSIAGPINGTLGLKAYYEQERDTVELLILGSSHAYKDVNSAVLYDEYGISSYVLGGPVQSFWNSYFYLIEALKNQHPKLVVLEGHAATMNTNYKVHADIVRNTLCIKDIKTRIGAIVASAPRDKIDDYIFSYRLWHTRYQEINEFDFQNYWERPCFEYFKGSEMLFSTQACECPDVESFQGTAEINRKEELYFRKIIELCQQQEIPVMVIISPWAVTENAQQRYNYLESVALEYQIPFINYNSEEAYDRMALDFGNDMMDIGHLNYRGGVKYTNVLGEDIQNYIPLSDHRGDARYSSWEMNSKDIHARIADFEIASATTCDELAAAFDGSIHSMYLYAISDTDRICENTGMFDKLEIKSDLLQDGELYLMNNLPCRQISDDGLQWEYEEFFDGKWLSVKSGLLVSDSRMVDEKYLVFDGKQYVDSQQGIYLFIYDNFTKEFVGVKHVRMNGDGDVEILNK